MRNILLILITLIISSHDVGIAIQNTIVAAESMGLGNVDIGAIRIKFLEVIKLLNLPKYVILLIGLCVGYPDADSQIKSRFPHQSVCFENKYDTKKAKTGVDEYDEAFKNYLSNRGCNTRDSNGTKSIYDIYSKAAISAEDIELLKQKGFIFIYKK